MKRQTHICSAMFVSHQDNSTLRCSWTWLNCHSLPLASSPHLDRASCLLVLSPHLNMSCFVCGEGINSAFVASCRFAVDDTTPLYCVKPVDTIWQLYYLDGTFHLMMCDICRHSMRYSEAFGRIHRNRWWVRAAEEHYGFPLCSSSAWDSYEPSSGGSGGDTEVINLAGGALNRRRESTERQMLHQLTDTEMLRIVVAAFLAGFLFCLMLLVLLRAFRV